MESRTGGPVQRGSQPGYASRIPANARYYRVRRGDTLYAIAWRANRDYRELARWNGIRSPYVIYEGQTIRLTPVTSASGGSADDAQRRASRSTVTPRKDSARRRSVPQPEPKAKVAPTRGLDWIWPSEGRVVSRYKSGDALRKGIKITAREGHAVQAAEAGKVVYSGSGLIGYGRLIIIKHNDKYLSAYGHNRKLLVEQNQQVTKGQKIAEMGRANDGRALLHFEIRRYGKPVDPLAMLPRR